MAGNNRRYDAIRDGLTLTPTIHQMNDLPKYLYSIHDVVQTHGAVKIRPPREWIRPFDITELLGTVNQREQVLPRPPFAKKVKESSENDAAQVSYDAQDVEGRICADVLGYDVERQPMTDFKKNSVTVQNDISKAFKLGSNDWRNMRVLERAFWTAMENGLNGVQFSPSYAPDIAIDTLSFKKPTKALLRSISRRYGPLSTENERRLQRLVEQGIEAFELMEAVPDDCTDDELKGYNAQKERLADMSLRINRLFRTNNNGPRWSASNINEGSVVRHMAEMPGINEPMYYIGQAFTYFAIHVEDLGLGSISYLHSGAPKVWYVSPKRCNVAFKEFLKGHIYAPGFIGQGLAEAKREVAKKRTIFNPSLVYERHKEGDLTLDMYRIVQEEGTFLYTAPLAIHFGFNAGYNVAEATNYGNTKWFEVGMKEALIEKVMRAKVEIVLPFEFLLYNETQAIIRKHNSLKKDEAFSPYELNMVQDVFMVWSQYIAAAEDAVDNSIYGSFERTIPFPVNTKTLKKGQKKSGKEIKTVIPAADRDNAGYDFFKCSKSGVPVYLFAEVCPECPETLIRCVRYLTNNGRGPCDIRHHRNPTLLSRFTLERLHEITNSMRQIVVRNVE